MIVKTLLLSLMQKGPEEWYAWGRMPPHIPFFGCFNVKTIILWEMVGIILSLGESP
jgi:hypothetical protein